jgi:MoaA/NifB/PqqE/SkfB family radical SAM enzyme
MAEKPEIYLYCKIIYRCNQKCFFCIANKYIQDKRPALTIEDLDANLEFFAKQYSIKDVVLSGGEPTLHPDFFRIIEIIKQHNLSIKLLTNCVQFCQNSFLKKIKSSIQKRNANIRIMFSVDCVPEQMGEKKKNGILNLAYSGLEFRAVVTITRQNKYFLTEILEFLLRLKEKYKGNLKGVEIRLIYLGAGTMSFSSRKAIPQRFNDIKQSLEEGLYLLRKNKILYQLWNLPLCYLNEPKIHLNEGMKKRTNMPVYIIDSLCQKEQALILDWKKELLSDKACDICFVADYCGGINREYIRKWQYPILKAVK